MKLIYPFFLKKKSMYNQLLVITGMHNFVMDSGYFKSHNLMYSL